jgi:hypothetical protein
MGAVESRESVVRWDSVLWGVGLGGRKWRLSLGAVVDGPRVGMFSLMEAIDLRAVVGRVDLPCATFRGCGNIRHVDWPTSLTSVGEACFEGCGLRNIDLSGTSLESIGARAFYDCPDVEMVDLPKSLREVGGYGFAGPVEWRGRGCGVARVSLGGTRVTMIGDSAFECCERLGRVALPPTLEDLGRHWMCFSGVTTVDLSGTNVTEFKVASFRGCGRLTHLVAPRALKIIRAGCFSQCGLASLDLRGTGLRRLDAQAFSRGCTRLRELLLPKTLKQAWRKSFMECFFHTLDMYPCALGERARRDVWIPAVVRLILRGAERVGFGSGSGSSWTYAGFVGVAWGKEEWNVARRDGAIMRVARLEGTRPLPPPAR